MSQAIPSFPDFGKLVPGFDFLQNLARQASGGAAQAMPQLPNLANWIAPTLNVEELDKRVQELKAVQFWLDQNAAALKATIQALEVQKMTLATLKGMNFNMAEMANAFTLKTGEVLKEGLQRTADQGKTFAGLEVPPSAFQSAKSDAAGEKKAAAAKAQQDEAPAAAGLVDPMQWWSALTQQFQAIATEAMKEVTSPAALDATTSIATDAVKAATDMAKGMAENATKTMTGGARAAMDTALSSTWPVPAKKSRTTAKTSTAAKGAAAKTTAATKTAAPARKSATASPRKTTR